MHKQVGQMLLVTLVHCRILIADFIMIPLSLLLRIFPADGTMRETITSMSISLLRRCSICYWLMLKIQQCGEMITTFLNPEMEFRIFLMRLNMNLTEIGRAHF